MWPIKTTEVGVASGRCAGVGVLGETLPGGRREAEDRVISHYCLCWPLL